MTTVLNPLVLDLVEWCLKQPRHYSDVMDAWRTSCPRLTIWEDAVDAGFLARASGREKDVLVTVTALGRKLLAENGRT